MHVGCRQRTHAQGRKVIERTLEILMGAWRSPWIVARPARYVEAFVGEVGAGVA